MKHKINFLNIRLFCLMALWLLLAGTSQAQGIYEQEIKNIDGNTIRLNGYKGKKLLVITLSGQESDSSIMSQLTIFQSKYQDKIETIGVADFEDGYSIARKKEIKKSIKNSKVNLTITEGMKVKKTSGSEQSPFMKWLTDKNGNKHFNQDVEGVGHKFFMDETGDLYAVIGPRLTLQAPIIDRIMNRPSAK
jgi:glutathione peroxidase